MNVYGLIQSGIVTELFTPPVNATLADCFAPAIAAMFVDVTSVAPVPQPGWHASVTGGVWSFSAPPAPPAPTPAQQATAALSVAVVLVSTGTASLDGTYAIDADSRSDILGEMVALLVNATFTNGTTSLGIADTSGAMHTFTVAQFKAFATAIGAYVAALKAIAATGTGTLPAATVTIA